MASRKADGQSPLAKAQSQRGRDPGNVIGGQVVERIVNNSTKEFQDYLASVGGGNAMAAANQAVSAAPPMPTTAYDPAMFAPPPAPMLSPMAPQMDMGMAMGGVPMMPPPPMLGVPQAQGFDPEREALLRYLGMI